MMPFRFVCCIHRSSDSQCFSMGRTTPQKLPTPLGDLDPRLIHGSLAHPSLPSNRHLDRFSRFCSARQLDHQTHSIGLRRLCVSVCLMVKLGRRPRSVCSNRPHLVIATMRLALNIHAKPMTNVADVEIHTSVQDVCGVSPHVLLGGSTVVLKIALPGRKMCSGPAVHAW